MHNVTFSGRVERGEGLASRLGCPTANIAIEQGVVIPGLGIYVGEAEVDGKRHQAVAYISDGRTGYRLKMEIHLLDVCMDLVGKHMRVVIFEKIRDSIPFPGEEKMAEIIKQDLVNAKAWFAEKANDNQE